MGDQNAATFRILKHSYLLNWPLTTLLTVFDLRQHNLPCAYASWSHHSMTGLPRFDASKAYKRPYVRFNQPASKLTTDVAKPVQHNNIHPLKNIISSTETVVNTRNSNFFQYLTVLSVIEPVLQLIMAHYGSLCRLDLLFHIQQVLNVDLLLSWPNFRSLLTSGLSQQSQFPYMGGAESLEIIVEK